MLRHRTVTRVRTVIVVVVAALLAALLPVAPAQARSSSSSAFDDVPAGTFYSDAVAWLADTGITTGTSATTFSPDDPVTRAQMAAFIERYAGVDGDPGEHGFADVPAATYYDGAVSFLAARGITTGTSPTTYAPNDVVTRAQMATFLWRYENEPIVDDPNPFSDVPAGTYYTDAVRWLAATGITTGTSATTYSPDDVVTRAQMATFLWRLAGEPAVGSLGQNRIDPEHTIVADADDADFVSLDTTGESTIEWTAADRPDVGDVVVFDETSETPDGFLGKVVEVDGDVVTTEPATITEAIPEGDLEYTGLLEEEGLGGLALASSIESAFQSAVAGCSAGATATLTAGVDLDPTLTLTGGWDDDGIHVALGFSVDITPSVSLETTGTVECNKVVSRDGPTLKKIKFYVGGVPVFIEPKLSFEAEFYASINGASEIGWSYTDRLGFEVAYDRGDWSIGPVAERLSDPVVTKSFEGSAVAGIELRPRLDLLVYGAAGPYFTLGPFFEVSAQTDDPWWSIDAGLRARAGMKFDTWFFEEEVEFGQLDLLRYTLAEADATDPNDQPPTGFIDPDLLETTASDAGAGSSCAIDAADRIVCWGSNDWVLGEYDTKDDADDTVLVYDDGSLRPVDISVGSVHACALMEDGSIWCWGTDADGRLGSGFHIDRGLPGPVAAIDDALQVSAGFDHTCAVRTDFSVWCWGDNTYGQLGNNEYGTIELRPVRVDLDGGVRSVSAGQYHSCATMLDGTGRCWGGGGDGELGDGQGISVEHPVVVAGLGDVAKIEAGSGYSCAVHDDGRLSCWGRNGQGRLGDPSFADHLTPYEVTSVGDVRDVSLSFQHTCVLSNAGQVRCFGANDFEQLGGSDLARDTSPVLTNSFDGALNRPDELTSTSISGGGYFTCAQSDGGHTRCWGRGFDGMLGFGTTDSENARTVREPT